jgi:thioredoxin-like negative regulator of GroEL
MAFYQSFNLAGETPTGNAVTGLETALVALPDDDAIRLLLVEEYARQKRFPAAMATLAPLANSPHDSPQRENARGRMAQLKAEAGSSKAAPAAAS